MGKPRKTPQTINIVNLQDGEDEVIGADGLTIKQRLFIEHYIVCMNGTEAARLAGYGGDDKTLAVAANKLVRNGKVLREIDRRLNSFSMSANEVLVRLTDIARGDIGDVIGSVGNTDITEAKRRGKSHIVKRFKSKTFTTDDGETHETEVEMYDALDALKTLAKFHALLVDRVKVDDWRSQAIEDIKAGRLTYGQLATAFSDSLAAELFASAGVPVQIGTGENR